MLSEYALTSMGVVVLTYYFIFYAKLASDMILQVLIAALIGLVIFVIIECVYYVYYWLPYPSDYGIDEEELQIMCWSGLRKEGKSFSYEDSSA